MNFLKSKKIKLTFLALLLGFTVILGAGCGNNSEKEKQQVEEDNKKSKESNKNNEASNKEQKEENKKDTMSKMNEATKKALKQTVDSLNKTYEGKMIVTYIEDKNDLVFEYIGSFKKNFTTLMDNKNNETMNKIWKKMVDSQVKYSENLKKVLPGMSIVILSPKDKNEELLRIKDGVVEYDYFK